jgi:hypothetical protein
MSKATIRSSQKIFTEEEVSGLIGINLEDLRSLARSRHLGFFIDAAGTAEQWLFTNTDLMVLSALHLRCQH